MSNLILDPTSLRPASKTEIIYHDPKFAEFAAGAETPFKALHLTVVCEHCGSGVRMQNAPSDTRYSIECECSIRRLRTRRT
jgi:hypothetical protein